MTQTTVYSNLGLFDNENHSSVWNLNKINNYDKIPPKQLLKWIGNKQRFAAAIAKVFPANFNKYFEPFVGSGAVLGAIAPRKGIAGDILKPLIDMWNLLKTDPQHLYDYYEDTWEAYMKNPKETYTRILASYNQNPNPLDLVFISRSCYGGVIRFTKQAKMSTPIGPHKPIPPEAFKERMVLWRNRIKNTTFISNPFEETMSQAGVNDIIYCDPPYVDSQAILYGAQAFKLPIFGKQLTKRRNVVQRLRCQLMDIKNPE